MSMLVWIVAPYPAVAIAIGRYAATRVTGSADFVVAGRKVFLHIFTATALATWFGFGPALTTKEILACVAACMIVGSLVPAMVARPRA